MENVTGIVQDLGEWREIPKDRKVRDIIVSYSKDQSIHLQLWNEDKSQIENIDCGDTVTVYFSSKARKTKGKDIRQNNKVLSITKVG